MKSFAAIAVLFTSGSLCAAVSGLPGKAGVLPAGSRVALADKVARPGILTDPRYFVWGASCVKGGDGKYHLYFDRWERENPRGMYGWLYVSEIAHAVADAPEGPWKVTGVVVAGARPESGDYAGASAKWDGLNAHNAMIARMPGADGKVRYYLYFIVNHDTRAGKDDWWNRVLGQRIAMAVSDKPEGPFVRCPTPVCEPNGLAHLYVVNPGVCRLPDGRYLMVLKGRESEARNSRMIHVWATADKPEGPFKVKDKPLFPPTLPAEDPCVWVSGDKVYAAVKDWHGKVSGTPGIAYVSGTLDAAGDIAWSVPKDASVSPREIRWSDGVVTKLDALERPYVLCDDTGKPTHLFAAAAVENPFVNGSPKPREKGRPVVPDASLPFNLCVPLVPASGTR